ncbi:hypothetical protein MRB53_035756 [Persea americana]|uniref:Uncharacterized protein n=1 Tax=Persea americana TaxID=3435 RepID=A0ACC2K5I6_PERAE|nr:hypothetical protein MRB53_035756 [Persea americana]
MLFLAAEEEFLGVGFVGYGELWRTLSLIAFIMRCCNGVLGCMMGPNRLVISYDASVCCCIKLYIVLNLYQDRSAFSAYLVQGWKTRHFNLWLVLVY